MSFLGYLNGEFVATDAMQVPVQDSGFVLGVTIAEQLRTFRGEPFRVSEHLARMTVGLSTVGLADDLVSLDFESIIRQVVDRNRSLLHPHDDMGLTVFATPGTYAAYAQQTASAPTCGVLGFPLAFHRWAHAYETSQQLAIVDIRQVPPSCWPPEIKCRSRMHYFLADREARRLGRQVVAVLLDERGFVADTPIANLVAHLPHEGLVSPTNERILEGISLRVLSELARQLNIPWTDRDLHPDELMAADDLMLTSTPYSLLPAQLLGHPLAKPSSRPVYAVLLHAWNDLVQLDIAAQAAAFATRGQ